MEVVEDDVFFADLSNRISLLIMDDDEVPISHCPPVSFQAFSQGIHPMHMNQSAATLIEEQNCRREIKGTGVFIPRSMNPRRKNKPGRFTSSNNTTSRFHTHRRSDHMNSRPHLHLPHHEPPYNNTNTSYNSFNHKRC